MYPSDYRYNPFGDYPTGVMTVERHVVPSKSPHVVILNEVPLKESPSTLSVKEILTYRDGRPSYGGAFSEVAATPAAGQVFPDYNTKADGTEAWNTGRLLFNSKDAGKMIEVTYKATGTLAGVASNRFPAWWTDRGDGSDGAFIPTEDCTISGLKNYTYVYIPAGVTVTLEGPGDIKVLGAAIIDGVLQARRAQTDLGTAVVTYISAKTVDGPEYRDHSVDRATFFPVISAGGYSRWNKQGSRDGLGDSVRTPWGAVTESVKKIIFYNKIFVLGGNAGIPEKGVECDTPGGGCLYMTAAAIRINGSVNADGVDGDKTKSGGRGGSGGGAVFMVANSIDGAQRCTAKGGKHTGNGSYNGTDGEDGFIMFMELGTGV